MFARSARRCKKNFIEPRFFFDRPRKPAIAGDRNRAGFFGNDDDDRIGLLAQAECGAMPRPDAPLRERLLCERKKTARGFDDMLSNDRGAIVERRSRCKDRE